MSQDEIIRKTAHLLFGVPLLCIALGILAGMLSLFNLRDENIAYVLSMLACVLLIFVLAHYALGKAATLLGRSWVLFGLLPVLFIPFGQMLAWLTLVDRRRKLIADRESMNAGGGEAAGAKPVGPTAPVGK